MNGSPNYTDLSKEEKEALANRRMDEMRLKNEILLQRYAEVENDRMRAESQNSAVTGASKSSKKDKDVNNAEGSKESAKVEHAREWDRGKPDKEHWRSPEYHGSSFKNYRSSGRNRRDSDRKENWGGYSRNDNSDRSRYSRGTDGRHQEDEDGNWGQNYNKPYNKVHKSHQLEDSYEKRKDTWTGYSRNESTDHYRSEYASDSRKPRGNYRFKQTDNNQHVSTRLQVSPKRTRGLGYRSSDSYRKSRNSYSDDKYKRSDYNRSNSRKKYSYRAHSRSTSRSGSDRVENQFPIRAYNLWQNDKMSEDQTKKNRVEKWVKSVNKTNLWGSKQFSPEQKDQNVNKFGYEQIDKNTGKVPPEPKEKNRSFTKFDRYQKSINKSSEDENNDEINISRRSKSREDRNYTSQPDYHANQGPPFNSESAKQMGGLKKKTVQTKRSPQYSSGSSTRNENFRKQRRFDGRGKKNDDRYKPKRHDNTLSSNDNTKGKNDSLEVYSKSEILGTWRNENTLSANDSRKNLTLDSTKKKTESFRVVYSMSDIEGAGKDSHNIKNKSDSFQACSKSEEIDGFWSNADQSHIKWKISDEETEKNQKKPAKNVNTRNNSNDNQFTSNSNKSRPKEQRKEKSPVKVSFFRFPDDGIWSNVDISDRCWKSEPETCSQEGANQNSEFNNSESTSQKAAKKDLGDGSASGTNVESISECHSDSASRVLNSDIQQSHCDEDMMVKKFKHYVYIGDNEGFKVSVNYSTDKPITSDDGGWSTVSEEGEVHSDDDANKHL